MGCSNLDGDVWEDPTEQRILNPRILKGLSLLKKCHSNSIKMKPLFQRHACLLATRLPGTGVTDFNPLEP